MVRVAFMIMLVVAANCGNVYRNSVSNVSDWNSLRSSLGTNDRILLHLKGNRAIVTTADMLEVLDDSVWIRKGILITQWTPMTQKQISNMKLPTEDVLFVEYKLPEEKATVFISKTLVGAGVVASTALTIFCLTNPKACFGSCPTFYNEKGDLVAEGFSLSIMKSLEMWDLDRIDATVDNGLVRLLMKNEALETHLVRNVRLIAVPRNGYEVYFDRKSKSFIRTTEGIPPFQCEHCELDRVTKADHVVYVSEADSNDLARRDTLVFYFKNPGTRRIALNFKMRNSLLGTHIMYGIIGLAGYSYFDSLRAWDSQSTLKRTKFYYSLRSWSKIVKPRIYVNSRLIASLRYEGPIAFEDFTVTFDNPGTDTIVVGFAEVKGDWEIDRVTLSGVVGTARDYIQIDAQLPKNHGDYLVTYPGDTLVLEFPVGDGDYQFFLKTRGYYYEWQREEWMKDANPELAFYLLFHPDSAYRYFARSYKAGEPNAREIFFKSRIKKGMIAFK